MYVIMCSQFDRIKKNAKWISSLVCSRLFLSSYIFNSLPWKINKVSRLPFFTYHLTDSHLKRKYILYYTEMQRKLLRKRRIRIFKFWWKKIKIIARLFLSNVVILHNLFMIMFTTTGKCFWRFALCYKLFIIYSLSKKRILFSIFIWNFRF